MKGLRRVIAGFVFVVAAAFLLPSLALFGASQSSSFRAFAESKVSDFLRAEVRIGRIRPGFPNQITFDSLEVFPDSRIRSPYRIEVGSIAFRYSLVRLLTFQFRSPSSVVLKTPRLVLLDMKTGMPAGENSAPPSGFPANVELAGGEIRYDLPALHRQIIIDEIRGNFQAAENGRLKGNFRAAISGGFHGQVTIEGEIDPSGSDWEFDFILENPWFGKDSAGERTLKGRIRRKGSTLYLDFARGRLMGHNYVFKGSLSDFESLPLFMVSMREETPGQRAVLKILADLRQERLRGSWEREGFSPSRFKARLRRRGERYEIHRLTAQNGGTGKAILDFGSGFFSGDWSRGTQRIKAEAALRGDAMHVNYHVDHVTAGPLDIAAAGILDLTLPKVAVSPRSWEIEAAFETDYFILDSMPLDDLAGRFRLTPDGFEELRGSWGRVFSFVGRVPLEGDASGQELQVKVAGFDLDKARSFATKPLPSELGGLVEGRLKLAGPLTRPLVSGQFSIKDGRLGKIDYDRGFVQFSGYPPYLKLEESRILRGRMRLQMEGALDLSLNNIFHGIRIQTANNIVLWRGWEANSGNAGKISDIEIQTAVKRLPAFSVKALDGTVEQASEDQESDAGERIFTIGPKFKF